MRHCLEEEVAGRPLAQRLAPAPDDYFVLKPKHSAFFSTTLDTLLKYLGVERLILTGITADMCLLITAADAHMRDFELHVPRDCTAALTPAQNRMALDYMKRVTDADLRPSTRLDLRKLLRARRSSKSKAAT